MLSHHPKLKKLFIKAEKVKFDNRCKATKDFAFALCEHVKKSVLDNKGSIDDFAKTVKAAFDK